MATIIDGKKRVPFLRGMLTHYLIENGFQFLEAYRIADQVRSALQKKKSVPAEAMIDLVHEQVRKLYGDRPVGNGVFWAPRPRQIMVEDERGTRPFSRGHLSHSLTTTGLDETRAYRLAERIVADFVQQGKTTVRRDNIRKVTLSILNKECGEEFSERYRIWNWFRNRDHAQPLIVLIGGASGVGKTSVAVSLANLLRISRVASTDEIRQVMRLMIAPNLMPALHSSSYAAWEALTVPPPANVDPVVHAFREQAMRVCVGVQATVERAIEENESLILDGVHLLPDLAGLDAYRGKALIIWVNLFLPDEQSYAERFEARGKEASRRPPHKYMKYLPQIQKIQQHILDVGEAHHVPAFENSDLDEAVQSIALHIMDTLRKEEKNVRNGAAGTGRNGKK